MLGLGLSALLLLAAPADTSAPAGEPRVETRVETRMIDRIWLRGPGLDQEALAGAVAARLAGKQILTVGQAADPREGLAALCHVSQTDSGQLRLEVILNDGRLYARTIAARGEGHERAAARLIAATVAAIEDASATPDRRDGIFAVPDAIAGPPEPVLPSPPDPEITATDESTPGLPTPVTDAGDPPEAPPPHQEPLASVHREPPALGLALELGPGFGLGAPSAGRGLASGGAGLRLDLRLPRGLTLAAGFRGHTRLRDGLALGRFRWALLVGHTLRRGDLELSLLAGPTLETWQLTRRGAAVAYTTSSSSGAALLLGGLARAAIGGRLQRHRLAARLGGYLEFAGSARTSGRAAQIARTDLEGRSTPVFLLGGAELSVGVEVELWFALRRGR